MLGSAYADGSYFPTAWPLLGLGLLLPAAALMLLGAAVSRLQLAAAGALVATGLVAVASTAWGGLPDNAWKALDQSVIGAVALLLGALMASVLPRSSAIVLGGVLAGTCALALELGYRLQAGTAPASWFDGRKIDGPAGYHNAQAAFFALGIPLALWLTARAPAAVRFAGGFAAVVLTAALILTQSRGGIIAVLLAIAVQLALSRDARLLAHTVAILVAGGVLFIPFRHVDAALVDGTTHSAAGAFRSFSGYALLAALIVGGVCALPLTRLAKRAMLALAAAAVVALLAAAVPHAHQARSALHRALNGEKTSDLPAGRTRLTSLSLSGRRQIWSIAWQSYEKAPVLGHGSGRFTDIFTRARTNHDLYVLEPHSIELEYLQELGLPGLAAFAAFVTLLGVSLARGPRRRAEAAAGAAVVVALLAQASIDWTFSFPALVAATLLVAGAAGGRGALTATRRPALIGGVAVTVVAAVAFAGPYLAAHELARAKSRSASADSAWQLLRHARGFDPWNADVIDYQGQLAEGEGRFRQAAALYAKAEPLSRLAWVEEYRRARSLRSAHLLAAARASCRRAQALNPLEQLLQRGPCDFSQSP